MSVVEHIKTAISKALEASSGVVVPPADIPLEFAELAHGDYATSVALQKAKEAGMPPKELAVRVAEGLGEIEGVMAVNSAGPGYINFTLSGNVVHEAIETALSGSWKVGGEGDRVMVEYTQPNPFKEFHIGHLMSNALGESFARLLEFSGARVIRANYQGDVGLHVAKAMYVLMQNRAEEPMAGEIGKAYVEGSRRYESDEAAKLEIDALNAEIYALEDADIRRMYEHGRKVCLEAFERLYEMLGTKFDAYFFESETAPRGLRLVREHDEVFEPSEGAIIFPGEKYGLHTRVFINRVGLPTYEAKDLGLAEMKKEYADCARYITVTASEQNDYFAVLTKAIELVIPELGGKIEHRSHGMMRFAEGKMSSRKGNVVTGESLLRELADIARERAKESRADNTEQLAGEIAVAALKYQVLRQSAGKDIVFDRERALSLEGDSGPYLQYAHARCCAILRKAVLEDVTPALNASLAPGEVERLLVRFPAVALRAAHELEPHHVATYAISLAALFNRWYAEEQILDGTPGAPHKLVVVDAVRATLKEALSLLGIPAPTKM